MRERRSVYRVLVGKPEGKRPLGSPRRRWKGNIKMEVGCGGTDWIQLAQDRDRWRTLVNAVYPKLNGYGDNGQRSLKL